MLSGIDALNGSFIADLNQLQDSIAQVNQQISSGVRVSQPSDDPTAIAPILDYQNQIDQITQVQTNLQLANTNAQAADGALQSATTLLNQLLSIATEGASSTISASQRASLGQQVESIEQQLVSVANTSINGQYIFGGDDPTTQPYTFNWSSPEGVVQNNTASSTATITDASGNSIVSSMTAQQIFDAKNTDGTPAAGNVFNAAYSLGQALLNNDQTGTANAATAIQAAAAQVTQASAFYGNTENWIQGASNDASASLTNLQQLLSGLRDTDVAAAATQLTTDQTALQAAISAHASLDNRTLFSYLG